MDLNKLGFGFLRLPFIQGTDKKKINLKLLNQMVDTYISSGKNYFDTAYTYLDGKSEWAIRESVVKRYPRNSFILADKLPGYLLTSHEMCYQYFQEQLQRCQANYFDVYLLHWLNEKNYRIAEKYQEFEFLQEMKASGKVIKTGFSYHDSAELLDEILTAHPEVDYVQLQINYLDWESKAIQSRHCYEIAEKHRKKVIVMEPVKGGTLANPSEEAKKILQELSAEASPASFAIRFAESLPNVEVVLSGMNTMEQLLDNLQEHKPVDEREKQMLMKAADIINCSTEVPCTGCGYCLSGCPKHICIPDYFKLYNEYSRNPQDDWKIMPIYQRLTMEHGKPEECIGCKKCESLCPQKLSVTEYLLKVKECFYE